MVAVENPAPLTGKRKRNAQGDTAVSTPSPIPPTLQIITGSYERVLHGLTASFSRSSPSDPQAQSLAVSFSDQFLFNAHASSIRSLALSPSSNADPKLPSKRILATGGMDERINLYSISTSAPPKPNPTDLPSLLPLSSAANQSSRNRELGSLMHHSSTVSALHFPSRGKLLSASYDNTIAISRTRDWTVLSTIRAPVPKPIGRPSGDTAAPGEVPAGINDVAVHPSAKLCLSVGQGERCMRLWNLVTGKKAGVLTFEKPILSLLGEGRWRGGEGRSVVWSDDGEEFAVGFEKGAVVYGLDCQVRGVARISGTKICQTKYIPHPTSLISSNSKNESMDEAAPNTLVMSTEDGRIIFFDTSALENTNAADSESLLLKPVGQLGVVSRGKRIKDFQIFSYTDPADDIGSKKQTPTFLVATGSSDGAVSLWSVESSEITSQSETTKPLTSSTKKTKSEPGTNGVVNTKQPPAVSDEREEGNSSTLKQVGTFVGVSETARRITCLGGFFMDAPTLSETNGDGNGEDDEEWQGFDGAGEEDEDDDSEDASDSDSSPRR